MAASSAIAGLQIDKPALAALCGRYGVTELMVFGSAVRGEARPDSDVDLLVDFQPGSMIDLVGFAALMQELGALLRCEVDLVSKRGLKPAIRDSVLAQARPLYAA